MSSSESYQDENIYLSADEEENQSQHFNSDEEEIEEIPAYFSGLQPYQLEPERVVITDRRMTRVAKKNNQDQSKEKRLELEIQHGVNATNVTGKGER